MQSRIGSPWNLFLSSKLSPGYDCGMLPVGCEGITGVGVDGIAAARNTKASKSPAKTALRTMLGSEEICAVLMTEVVQAEPISGAKTVRAITAFPVFVAKELPVELADLVFF